MAWCAGPHLGRHASAFRTARCWSLHVAGSRAAQSWVAAPVAPCHAHQPRRACVALAAAEDSPAAEPAPQQLPQGSPEGYERQAPASTSQNEQPYPAARRRAAPRGRQQAPPAPMPWPQGPPPGDQLAAFRAFQQVAALRTGSPRATQSGGSQWGGRSQGPQGNWPGGQGRGWDGEGPSSSGNWQQGSAQQEPPLPTGERLANFRRLTMTKIKRSWYAGPRMTAMQIHDEVMRRAARKEPVIGALFMLCRLAASAEDMRAGLSACVAVRAAAAQAGQTRRPLGGPRLALRFVEACVRCDAPEVLASAMLRANEAGLLISYHSVHAALTHWATQQELHKVDQVLEAMRDSGLPFTTRTAYVAIRGAVNAGRQEAAEAYANMFTDAGVRLHPTAVRLLEVGRERHAARMQALREVSQS